MRSIPTAVKGVPGLEVIRETVSLLRSLRFGPRKSAYAKGRHVAIHIDCEPHSAAAGITAIITCFAFGRRSVRWQGLPIVAEPSARLQGTSYLAFLNGRGQAVMEDLPAAEYAVTGFEQVEPEEGVLIEERTALAWAAAGTPIPGDQVLDGPHSFQSNDTRLIATLKPTPQGVEIVFETERPELANAVVEFALLDAETQEIRVRGSLRMSPVREGVWRGVWPEKSTLGCRFKLLFGVVEEE